MKVIPIEKWGCDIRCISEATENPKWKYPITIDPIKELFDEVYKSPSISKKLFSATFKNVNVLNGRILDEKLGNEVKEFSVCGDLMQYQNPITVNSAIHLIDRWGDTNYWHWISSCMSKLCMLDSIPQDTHFLVNSLDKSFVRESLVKFGIDLSQCIEMSKAKSIFCNELIAPSPIGDRDKEGVLYLRDIFREDIESPSKRVFISRSNERRVENEQEVMGLLEKFGFEFVKCEELSFDEQVSLFSNTNAVISPHGAGLTNLIFTPDNVKVLELRSPLYFGSCYWKLCNHLGIEYYSLYGEGEQPKTTADLCRNLSAAMTIELDKLEETLGLMGLGEV